VVLALIPAGTCNDFARYLSFPAWRDAALSFEASAGKEELFDLGLMTVDNQTRVFFNNAGFGRNPGALRSHRPNPIKDILSFEEKELTVTPADGSSPWRFPAYLGIVFNAPFFNKGMYFDRSVGAQDARLDAFFVPPCNRFSLVGKFALSRMGKS